MTNEPGLTGVTDVTSGVTDVTSGVTGMALG